MAEAGSDIELIGGEFQLNGAAFSGSTISISAGDVLTGTLSDGSAFVFAPGAGDFQLTSATLPTLDVSPMVVSASNPSVTSGLRPGQTLTLQTGGELPDGFTVAGGTLNVEGGNLGSNVAAANSTVNISGGTGGFRFDAFSGSEINISGGIVGSGFDAFSGSEVNISGGTVLSVRANSGSEVNISGGSAGASFGADTGSVVNISGGVVGSFFRSNAGSDVELIGGEFQLNGAAVTDSTISLSFPDILTGTLADGSVFIFSAEVPDRFSGGVQLTSAALPALDLTPVVVSTPNPNLTSGLRSGQSLRLLNGGELGDDFEVVDATLNVEGGILGRDAGVSNSMVNISGGNVGYAFRAFSGSVVNITGGNLKPFTSALAGSEFNISGGSFGIGSSNVNSFIAGFESTVNISGGSFGDDFQAFFGSEINLFGSNFVLDGVLLDDSLTIGDAFTIVNRNVTLSGLLADGSPFSFDLLTGNRFSREYFDPDATLTVTLVPPAPEVILGDCDLDGDVDFSDIPPFIDILRAGTFLEQADCNQDGVVNFSDIPAFIAILTLQ